MKKFSKMAVGVLLLVSLAACSTSNGISGESEANYTPGVYQATANGRGGALTVSVTFTQNAIEEVTVTEHHETIGISDAPIEAIPTAIVKGQTLDVDIVSGATMTSQAILDAVADCVKQAGGNPDSLKKKAVGVKGTGSVPMAPDEKTEVVVIGAGGAGMTAALNLSYAGKKVILLEQRGMVGGDTSVAMTAIGAVGTKVQKNLNVLTTPEDMWRDFSSRKGVRSESARILAENCGAAVDWINSLGANFTVPLGPAALAPADGSIAGLQVVKALRTEMDKRGVDYRLNTKAVKILTSNGRVSGVQAIGPKGEYTIHSKAVIITTGGYACNKELIAKYGAEWANCPNVSSGAANGSGAIMAEEIGAALMAMDTIKADPCGYVIGNGTAVSLSGIRFDGAILVNKNGKRFTSEIGDYTTMAHTVLEQPGGKVYLLIDQSVVDKVALVREYVANGYFVAGNSLEELADKIGVDKKNLVSTIATYQGYVDRKEDLEFHRPSHMFVRFDKPQYYAARVEPGLLNTYGGIAVTDECRVVSPAGTVMPNLYAAGDVAYHHLNGHSMLSAALVYGKIAAESAISDLR